MNSCLFFYFIHAESLSLIARMYFNLIHLLSMNNPASVGELLAQRGRAGPTHDGGRLPPAAHEGGRDPGRNHRKLSITVLKYESYH